MKENVARFKKKVYIDIYSKGVDIPRFIAIPFVNFLVCLFVIIHVFETVECAAYWIHWQSYHVKKLMSQKYVYLTQTDEATRLMDGFCEQGLVPIEGWIFSHYSGDLFCLIVYNSFDNAFFHNSCDVIKIYFMIDKSFYFEIVIIVHILNTISILLLF